MEPRDITNEILIGIRDEIRLTNSRLDGQQRILVRVAEQLGDLNGRVDHLTGRVDHLSGQVEHLTGEMVQVNGRLDRHDVRFAVMTDILTRMDRRFERVEGMIDRAFDVAANPAFVDLQRRVEALEHKTG